LRLRCPAESQRHVVRGLRAEADALGATVLSDNEAGPSGSN
jgi:hypothetical protein